MATERKIKTSVKKSSSSKHGRDCKESKTSSYPSSKGVKTPDPGPMRKK